VTPELVNLPEDSEALKAMVRSLLLERDRETQRAEQLRVEMLRMQLELERFRKWYYGPRADRLHSAGEVAQMLLAFAEELDRKPVDLEDAPPATEPADDARKVRRGKGRRKIANFDNLPVTTHVHELSAEERACPCCGAQRQEIGEDVSWQIEHYPARFERIQHLRKKYACAKCESKGDGAQVQTAAKPESAIDKGMAGPGLLAYIVTSKFADYLPLYRLEDIFERQGFEISRATQSIWCGDVADLVKPLYELMVARVRASHVVATDDTVMPMLARGKAANARMWVYVGDEAGPYNIFDFTLNRGRDGPKHFLKDYRNVLLADAYGGYNGVVAGNEITRAGCWAHARRKIVDAEKAAPEIAREAIELIGALYGVERRCKDLSAAARLALRKAETAPVLAALKEKFLDWKRQLLPKHPMAEAINYALGQWEELTVFCSDGAVPIDNNVSEREMKRVVLNRKNSLFVGNARGGRTAAILASLTSSCRRHGVDPQRYLTQLLVNLPAARMSELPAWLPDEWKRRQTPPPGSPTPA
jgi:transposase